jgi:hypothetical protein
VEQAVWYELFVTQTILVVTGEEASEEFGMFLVAMDRHGRGGYFSGLICMEQLIGDAQFEFWDQAAEWESFLCFMSVARCTHVHWMTGKRGVKTLCQKVSVDLTRIFPNEKPMFRTSDEWNTFSCIHIFLSA